MVSKGVSLACAVIFCVFALLLQPRYLVLYAVAYMIFPLAAIWYGDEIGSYSSGWRINIPSPGILVKVIGWILLMFTPLCIYIGKLRLGLGF
jgi:hypothetical protein